MGIFKPNYTHATYLNGMDNLPKRKFCGESVSMINNRLSLLQIGDIQGCRNTINSSTTHLGGSYVSRLEADHNLELTIIPAVNLHTSASLQKSSDIGFSGRFSTQLVPLQEGIVGGVDEIVREWLCHVLIHCFMLRINDWIVFATKKAGKRERNWGRGRGGERHYDHDVQLME